MDVQVAGPLRPPTGTDSCARDRQRQLTSNQKAGRVLGASIPAPFLTLDSGSKRAAAKGAVGEEVVLNSPISKCPNSWTSRFPTDFNVPSLSITKAAPELAQQPATGTLASVPPLNFKKRPHRKSFSMARIETEMTDYKRDAAQTFTYREASASPFQGESYWLNSGDLCIVRRQSLPETSARPHSGEGILKRHARPLPPVPLSRPVSPALSISSSQNSHSSRRPLPTPPTQAPVPSTSSTSVGLAKSEAPSAHSFCEPSNLPYETDQSPVSTKSRPGSDLFSPISPLSIITDLSGTLRDPSAPSPRRSEARRQLRIHASPYKLSHNPARYSTTSLSSQVSVPPAPSPAELRRRNREKMAKLIRLLGESPPSDLVFTTERHPMHDSIDGTITEESFESVLSAAPTLEPLQRSVSLGLDESTTFLFGKKALSDPDTGHGERAKSPTSDRSPPRRLRSRRGRADNDKVPRYVVSLFDTDESNKTSERLTFKLNAREPKLHPVKSVLCGAYKPDTKSAKVKMPPLPPKIPATDLPKHTQKWVREDGSNRWEVDDYENVVMSLRNL